jgi:hypothetical protein
MLDVLNVVERRWFVQEKRPQLVAYHEAGHAVGAIVCGWRFDRVTLISTWEYRGAVRGSRAKGTARTLQDDAATYAVILYAGVAAEGLILEREGSGWGGSLPDQVRACNRVALAFPDPAERAACLARARQQARELVRRYRPAIEALVEALWEAKELDYGQARRIVARAVAGRETESFDAGKVACDPAPTSSSNSNSNSESPDYRVRVRLRGGMPSPSCPTVTPDFAVEKGWNTRHDLGLCGGLDEGVYAGPAAVLDVAGAVPASVGAAVHGGGGLAAGTDGARGAGRGVRRPGGARPPSDAGGLGLRLCRGG